MSGMLSANWSSFWFWLHSFMSLVLRNASEDALLPEPEPRKVSWVGQMPTTESWKVKEVHF